MPTGGQSPVDKGRNDYTVYSGEWQIGRIYEGRGRLPKLRWFWTNFVGLPLRVSVRETARTVWVI
jgi:hypothetical protein